VYWWARPDAASVIPERKKLMSAYPFEKKPAFFPFVSAEVFFEAEETLSALSDTNAMEAALDAELEKLLATA
jgi:hypothetical protein